MTITINNQAKQVDENTSLQAFITATLGEKQKGIAVAVDGKIIPQTQWEQTALENNQDVLIIKATQGG